MIHALVFLSLLMPASFASTSATLPAVSVLRFNDETASIYEGCETWPWGYAQNQLRSQLEFALVKAGFPVEERRHVRELYADEFDLPNLDSKTQQKRRGFKTAKFTLAGALTEMGYCAEKSSTSVGLGGLFALVPIPGNPDLDLKFRRRTAKLKILLQVIDIRTAEHVKAFEAAAEAHENGNGITASLFGVGADHQSTKSSVLEAASAEAIAKLVSDLTGYFTN